MKVAFISGTSILRSKLFDAWIPREVTTRYGHVLVRETEKFAFVNRHGRDGLKPPHAIDHRANVQALVDLGYKDVVCVNSVGSLREDLRPGSFVSCSDYVSFHPATFDDEVARFEAPAIANNLIPLIQERGEFPIWEDAVYVQAVGPRFETRAEVRIIREWGDVVGMTFASEADLLREAGLRCNSLCMVDNYANGIGAEPITGERFHAQVEENQQKVNALLERMFAMFSELP